MARPTIEDISNNIKNTMITETRRVITQREPRAENVLSSAQMYAQSQLKNNIDCLVDIRDDGLTPKSVKVAAVKELNEIAAGKYCSTSLEVRSQSVTSPLLAAMQANLSALPATKALPSDAGQDPLD